MITKFQLKAIYKLYPQVSSTRGVQAFDKNDVEVVYDQVLVNEEAAVFEEQSKIDDCKTTAKTKLTDSDWSVLPDVNITNRAEFEAYRATIRNLVLNPVADPVFPAEPQPVWG